MSNQTIASVGGDSEELETANYAYHCPQCQRLYVLEFTEEGIRSQKTCPAHTRQTLTYLATDEKLAVHATCDSSLCSLYLSTAIPRDARKRCEGHETGKGGDGLCLLQPVTLTYAALQDLAPDNGVDDLANDPADVRRLKSLIHHANAWVHGAGAHHRSTSGHHGSAAVQTHSSAHQAKQQVRDRMAAALRQLATQVEKLPAYKNLAKEARTAANNVEGK